MADTPNDASGKRILVVEDEFFVALALEDLLRSLGYEVVGPVTDLEGALDLVRREAFDGAVLDVNLRGTPSLPVAEALAERGIPFILTTGYALEALPVALRDCPQLRKPFRARDLEAAAARTFTRSDQPAGIG